MESQWFETYTQYTFPEYIRFCRKASHLNRQICKLFFVLLALFLFVLYFDVFYISRAMQYLIPIGVLCFCVLVYVFFYLQCKKHFMTNKILQNRTSYYSFHENSVDQKDDNGQYTYQYADFYRGIETKTNFYFMISKNQGIVIIKQNCDPMLLSFLHDLCAIVNQK